MLKLIKFIYISIVFTVCIENNKFNIQKKSLLNDVQSLLIHPLNVKNPPRLCVVFLLEVPILTQKRPCVK